MALSTKVHSGTRDLVVAAIREKGPQTVAKLIAAGLSRKDAAVVLGELVREGTLVGRMVGDRSTVVEREYSLAGESDV